MINIDAKRTESLSLRKETCMVIYAGLLSSVAFVERLKCFFHMSFPAGDPYKIT